MDNKKHISEVVEYGSVVIALDKKLFSPNDLLEWLCKSPVNLKTIIAYRILCEYIPVSDQYSMENRHILTHSPEYTSIAVTLGLDQDIKACRGGEDPLIYTLVEVLYELNTKYEEMEFSDMLTTSNRPKNQDKNTLYACFAVRKFVHFSVKARTINKMLMLTDWTEKCRMNSEVAILIHKRINVLKNMMSGYYECVKNDYRLLFEKLNDNKLLYAVPKDVLKSLDTEFPNVLDQRILHYGDIAYKISTLDLDTAGYLLGFPMQHFQPNEEQIHKKLGEMTEHGVEKYLEKIKNTSKGIITQTHGREITFANDTDVLMEDISLYLPFDIVSCQIGNVCYRFSRPEFKRILESKKNHWTNEWLPPMILSTINSRYDVAKKLGLPEAMTAQELYKKLEEDSFGKSSSSSSNSDESDEYSESLDPALRLLYSMIFVPNVNLFDSST